MSLLSANDPRYWLAKIIAEPDKGFYNREDYKAVLSAVARANQAALAVLQGVSTWQKIIAAPFPWNSDPFDDVLYPFTQRMDAFSSKYVALLQKSNGAAQINAATLKADSIEMLTFAAATIDQIRNVYGNNAAIANWVAGLAGMGSSIYQAIAGTIKKIVAGLAIGGSVLITAGLAAVGLWAYVNLKRPSYRR